MQAYCLECKSKKEIAERGASNLEKLQKGYERQVSRLRNCYVQDIG